MGVLHPIGGSGVDVLPTVVVEIDTEDAPAGHDFARHVILRGHIGVLEVAGILQEHGFIGSRDEDLPLAVQFLIHPAGPHRIELGLQAPRRRDVDKARVGALVALIARSPVIQDV